MKNVLTDIHTHQTPCQALSPTASGVHPWSVCAMSEAELSRAVGDLEHARADVVGEIGLDYARAKSADAREKQRSAFRAQLAVAERRRLPVVLHVVRAFEDAAAILAEFALPAVVFHGFVGSPQQARRAVENGWFLSFGVRGFASPRTVEAMRQTPLDHIFLETDDAPTPIGQVYESAAAILKIPVQELIEQMRKNYGVVVPDGTVVR